MTLEEFKNQQWEEKRIFFRGKLPLTDEDRAKFFEKQKEDLEKFLRNGNVEHHTKGMFGRFEPSEPTAEKALKFY